MKIQDLFNGKNQISVPSYQRAYSWDSPQKDRNNVTQVDVFLNDIIEHCASSTDAPYYFGHFLFEKDMADTYKYKVVDGQQRMTTIVICVSAIISKLEILKKEVGLSEFEEGIKEDFLKKRSKIHFRTVEYDSNIFNDYIIDKNTSSHYNLDTISSQRIVKAFDYFTEKFVDKNAEYLDEILEVISSSSCTTHEVTNEAEAIQMFIFQNNRGKKPSNLEIIKAEFMYHIHLHGGDATDDIILDIKNRFEDIYRSISQIEYNISEDEVLNQTLKVFYNNLDTGNTLQKITEELLGENSVDFIIVFCRELTSSFKNLRRFFNEDERTTFEVHSLVSFKEIGLALPFILKAYKYNLSMSDLGRLCKSLESILLRNRLIGTRANLTTRLNGVYRDFQTENNSIQPIIDKIDYMKTADDGWWDYWNNSELKRNIQYYIKPSTARYILWKYENFLKRRDGEKGYHALRLDTIKEPHLEHFAPQKEPAKPHGYAEYDSEFRDQYLDCLGNYLLLSQPHNISISNGNLALKLERYTELMQHREIPKFISENGKWDKEAIQNRKDHIVSFILQEF